MNANTEAHPRATNADTLKYQQFSRFVEQIIKKSKTPNQDRAHLWVSRITLENFGGAS